MAIGLFLCPMRLLTRTVILLSLVSLFTDMASEMLYPVLPVYFREIGFSVVLIGLLEGFAGAAAGLSKGYFGRLSDQRGQGLPFVRAGYTLSALSKPMMAVFTWPWWVFLARTTDRLGKGVRTGARDGLLSRESTHATKGRVFGFHRGMDTLGAVLGPSVALLFLYYYPEHYRFLFLLAALPGALAVGTTLLVREKPGRGKSWSQLSWSYKLAVSYWKEAPPSYRRLVFGLLLFGLVNSSDFFLLLRLKETGLSDTTMIGMYILYNAVYAFAAFPFGSLGDRIGFRKTLVIGIAIFSVVYAVMAFVTSLWALGLVFASYGVFAAATEGISTAWISRISGNEKTASAVGTYSGLQSIAVLLSSSLAGWIWYALGSSAMFFITAVAAGLIALYFIVAIKR